MERVSSRQLALRTGATRQVGRVAGGDRNEEDGRRGEEEEGEGWERG